MPNNEQRTEDSPSSITNEQFSIGSSVLGTGSHSTVKLATNKHTKEQVAAKCVNLLQHRTQFEREVTALKKLKNHKGIVQYHGVNISRHQGVMFVEFLPYPTLYDVLRSKLDEDLVMKIFKELVDTVKYIHGCGVVHLDLKPENICLDLVSGRVVVFDFGLSLVLDPGASSSLNEFIGSPLYMSPQRLLREKENAFSADIWSLGILFLEMWSGSNPFSECKTMEDLLDCVEFISRTNIFPLPAECPPLIEELLRNMLHSNTELRWKIEQVHEFVKKM